MHANPTRANGSIHVHVVLPGALAQYRPEPGSRAPFALTMQRGSTLQDLLTALRLSEDPPTDLFVNGQRRQPQDVVPHAAEVQIFPALGSQ